MSVSVRFADEDLWLTQNQLAEIYCTTKQNFSQHIDNILKDGELEQNRTVKEFLTVRQDGKRQVYYYPFLSLFYHSLSSHPFPFSFLIPFPSISLPLEGVGEVFFSLFIDLCQQSGNFS